jgi:hypothetical protein
MQEAEDANWPLVPEVQGMSEGMKAGPPWLLRRRTALATVIFGPWIASLPLPPKSTFVGPLVETLQLRTVSGLECGGKNA